LSLDAIIIADTGPDPVHRPSPLNPPSLKLDGKSATIQAVSNYLKNQGQIVPPIHGAGTMSLWSAPRYNGIFLLSHLLNHDFRVELINKYYVERDHFRELLKQSPRAVIISTTFILTKESLRKLVDDIRSLAPDILIIAGGPFVYKSYIFRQRCRERDYVVGSAHRDFLFFDNKEPSIDLHIISRQGEDILCDALRRVKESRSLEEIPNTARLVGNEYHVTHFKDVVTNRGEVSVDWKSLPDTVFKSGVLPMQASGGCFHKCAFCTFRKDSRMIFLKPVERLIDEMKMVEHRGVRYVRFIDDNFRLGRPDLNTFCRRVVDEGLQIQWMTMIKISTLENTDVSLLRDSGCFEVALGLESTDPQVLKNMNKKADPERYGPGVERLLRAGINCSCYFLFGFPGETDETVHRTREFIERNEHPELEGILSWNLYTLIVAPLSPIYEPEMRKKYGLKGYMDRWKHRTMDWRQADEHVKEALYELDNSGPIYRGDNLDMLHSLSPSQRKAFYVSRYRLAKGSLRNQLEEKEIISTFEKIIPSEFLRVSGSSPELQAAN